MYSEKTFKNYIFWIQVKRIVLIILLSCIGAAIGVLVSELYESITKTGAFNVLIIVVSTILMFLLSLLVTTGTGKEVQDGYWKIAILRKLTTIQKLIEKNNTLLGDNGEIAELLPNKDEINKLMGSSLEKNKKSENDDIEYEDDVEMQNEDETEAVSTKTKKKKTKKTDKKEIEEKV